MITYRKLDLFNDYPELECIWEKSPMGVAPPLEALPADGVIVEQDGEIVGCILIYLTSNSYNAILGYPLLDKSVSEDRDSVITEMYNEAEYFCRHLGFHYLNTWTPLPHVEERLKSRNYQLGDVGVKHMIKIV